MKELSIEEKAKRYDEAIKVARQYYNDRAMPIGTNFKLEKMFPELEESEDKKLREQVVYAINQLHVCECTKNKLLVWLEKKGEQKPAWGKEDERYLSYAIHAVEDMLGDNGKNIVAWLKSLKYRYTWKPSDEQMNLLEELVEDNNQRYFYTILRSLYEQLKKLREE